MVSKKKKKMTSFFFGGLRGSLGLKLEMLNNVLYSVPDELKDSSKQSVARDMSLLPFRLWAAADSELSKFVVLFVEKQAKVVVGECFSFFFSFMKLSVFMVFSKIISNSFGLEWCSFWLMKSSILEVTWEVIIKMSVFIIVMVEWNHKISFYAIMYYIFDYLEEVVQSMTENMSEEIFQEMMSLSSTKCYKMLNSCILLEEMRSLDDFQIFTMLSIEEMEKDIFSEISKIYSTNTLYYYLVRVKKLLSKAELEMGRSNFSTDEEIIDLVFREDFPSGMVSLTQESVSFAFSALKESFKKIIELGVPSLYRWIASENFYSVMVWIFFLSDNWEKNYSKAGFGKIDFWSLGSQSQRFSYSRILGDGLLSLSKQAFFNSLPINHMGMMVSDLEDYLPSSLMKNLMYFLHNFSSFDFTKEVYYLKDILELWTSELKILNFLSVGLKALVYIFGARFMFLDDLSLYIFKNLKLGCFSKFPSIFSIMSSVVMGFSFFRLLMGFFFLMANKFSLGPAGLLYNFEFFLYRKIPTVFVGMSQSSFFSLYLTTRYLSVGYKVSFLVYFCNKVVKYVFYYMKKRVFFFLDFVFKSYENVFEFFLNFYVIKKDVFFFKKISRDFFSTTSVFINSTVFFFKGSVLSLLNFMLKSLKFLLSLGFVMGWGFERKDSLIFAFEERLTSKALKKSMFLEDKAMILFLPYYAYSMIKGKLAKEHVFSCIVCLHSFLLVMEDVFNVFLMKLEFFCSKFAKIFRRSIFKELLFVVSDVKLFVKSLQSALSSLEFLMESWVVWEEEFILKDMDMKV